MATLQYSGSNGNTTSLNNSPSTALSKSAGDISNYKVNSVVARLYMSTNAYSKTYSITVTLRNGNGVTVATGTASIKFTSSNYGGGTFDVTLTTNGSFNPNEVASMVVSCSTDGSKIFLKSSSGFTQYVNITYIVYTACAAPTTVSAPALVAPANGISVSWSGAKKGDNLAISGYTIFRAVDDPSGSYTSIGTLTTTATSGSYTDTGVTSGHTYYYKIRTDASVSGYNSEQSAATGGTYVNNVPAAPAIRGGNTGRTYNARPRLLVTLGTDADGQNLTVACQGFSASRSSAPPGARVLLRKNTAVSAGALTVTVTNTDPQGSSEQASKTITVADAVFTDDPVEAGTTHIKAAHINELRTMLDNVCAYYGIEATTWAMDVVAGLTPAYFWPGHMAEIQQTVARIANYINAWDAESAAGGVVLPSFLSVDRPNAAAINQAREMILLL